MGTSGSDVGEAWQMPERLAAGNATLRTARDRQTGALTSRLLKRSRDMEWDSLPTDVVIHARHCLLDWTGTALAGSTEPVSRLVRQQLADYGGSGQSTVLRAGTSSPRDAALANGVAGHALDFDDVLLEASGHVSAVVMPAVIAVSERAGVRGDDMLTSFVAGFELVGDLGVALGEQHYAQGFHATATLGVFGAAAAAAWLMHLDHEQGQHALGLAATSAAGLKSMFGTMAKPLHAGWAAQSGVMAADLARRGMTAAHGAIECHQGFAEAHGAPIDVSRLDARWHLRSNLFKYHPACFLTHASIDAARSLRNRHAVDAGVVDKITIRVHPGHLSVCNIARPTTGAESKFSLGYAVSAALSPNVDLWSAFTDAAVAEGSAGQMIDRVEVVPTPALPRESSEIEIEMAGGYRVSETCDATRELVEPDLAARERALSTKFLALTSPLLGAEVAEELRVSILATDETTNIRDLTRVLRDTGSRHRQKESK